jgi:hypothetical protein
MDRISRRILTGKRTKWMIVDEEGKILESGFRNKICASNRIGDIRLTKQDKLKVVEEDDEEIKKQKKKKWGK